MKKELKEELDRINNAGTITPENIHTVKDAVKLMLKLKKYEEWMMDEGTNSYNDGYSNRRGRSATTGRYVSRDSYPGQNSMRSYGMNHMDDYSGRRSYGYSGHTMLENLEKMYNEAQTEQERRMIEGWMNNMEMGR